MTTLSHDTTTSPLLTEAQLCAWIGQSAPSARIEYHRGFLAIDTVRASSNFSETDRKELVKVARRAWWAAEKNLVHLAQRRLGPDRFAYLVVARARPKTLHATLLTLLAETPDAGALANPDISLRSFRP
jgi:hypothetical protein